MTQRIRVKMAEYRVLRDAVLITTVGSCVAIGLIDPKAGVGALGHVMLPNNNGRKTEAIGKYADTAIPAMIKEMEMKGAKKSRMKAKIAGGAKMFDFPSNNFSIGEKNVKAVRKILEDYGIEISGEDVGKNYGRTIEFHTSTGKMVIKRANKILMEL